VITTGFLETLSSLIDISDIHKGIHGMSRNTVDVETPPVRETSDAVGARSAMSHNHPVVLAALVSR
jgi:hypothetical protein